MKELDNRTCPIRQDMAFRQRSGRLERSGWIVLARVVLAVLAGVVFHGPASHARARNADNSVAVDYERFAHKTALTCFTVRATAPDCDALMIRSSPALATTHHIESIAPRPLRQSGGTHVAAARHLHGLEGMEDIKFAILEANGKISVIPYASPNTVAAAQAS